MMIFSALKNFERTRRGSVSADNGRPLAAWGPVNRSIDSVKGSFKDCEAQHHLAVCVQSEEVSKIANNGPRLADLASNKIASICKIVVASSWQQSCHTNI